eukprot:TRINITY_DN2753_c0_g1_i11.p1 TRINITY_DN2753_c0_g1~~TRINITY_DN2753_c0_g1_i11.p1  ORF type:complete len:346 (-),score=54.90 TRINITY_DN2753_c0_g1_i11:194-1231(-)
MLRSLVGSEMCIRDSTKKRVTTGLPPCTEEVDLVTLGPSESELYQRVTSERLVQFNQLVHHSQTKVSSLGFKMHLLMLPMRQICAGGEIQVSSPDSGALTYSELPATATECPICQDFLEEPVKTPCSHWFCRDCLLHYFAVRGGDLVPCPYCRHQCHESQLAHYHQPSREPALVRKIETKLLAVLTRLSLTLSRDPHSKILLFSSFAGTLEWLAHRMRRDEIQFETINGTMSLAQRTSAIRAFQYNPASRVFLLSVRAGAVGINLTAANHVFLLDALLNRQLEEQVIGRVHRLGQDRAVTVRRFIVIDSIEERIRELVAREDSVDHRAGLKLGHYKFLMGEWSTC